LLSAAACLLSLTLIGLAPLAQASPLDDQQSAIENQLAAIQQQVSQNEDALNQANSALAASQQQLSTAQSDLAAKQQAVKDAQAQDEAMAAQLAIAQQKLVDCQEAAAAAEAAVAKGLADIARQRDEIGLIAQTAAQQNTTLMSLSMLLNDADFSQLNNQMQWATTVFTVNEHAIEALQAAQVQLEAAREVARQAEQAAAEAEAAVQVQKDATAAHLAVTQQAKDAAVQAAAAVQAKVAASQKSQADADQALKQSQAQLAQLNTQLTQIKAQIQAQLVQQQQQQNNNPETSTIPNSGDTGLAIAAEAALIETWGGGTYLWGGGHSTLSDLQNRLAHKFQGGSSYICYSGNCPRTPNGYGVDCSGFVRAVIYAATGTDIGQFLASYSSAAYTGYFKRIYNNSEAKPGDIFINDGDHTGVIVANYTSQGKFGTVEARGTSIGIGPTTRYYTSGYGIFRYIGPFSTH